MVFFISRQELNRHLLSQVGNDERHGRERLRGGRKERRKEEERQERRKEVKERERGRKE